VGQCPASNSKLLHLVTATRITMGYAWQGRLRSVGHLDGHVRHRLGSLVTSRRSNSGSCDATSASLLDE